MGGGVKKADTWMPFYVTDYLGDTMHLTTVQHGAYLLLLLACWKSGGELADDDATLATITRLSAADWRKHGPTLRAFFKSDGERLLHVRVLAELEKAQKLSDARSESGKKGGRPPKAKQEETNRFPDGLANAKQTETPSPSPSSLRSETEDYGAKAPASSAQEMRPAVAVAIALRKAGIQANSDHPRLTALCDAGATVAEFMALMPRTEGKDNPFAYLLGAVEGERKRAANTAGQLHRGPMPNKQEALEARNRAVGEQWLKEMEARNAQ